MDEIEFIDSLLSALLIYTLLAERCQYTSTHFAVLLLLRASDADLTLGMYAYVIIHALRSQYKYLDLAIHVLEIPLFLWGFYWYVLAEN